MKLLICGSRSWTDARTIRKDLDYAVQKVKGTHRRLCVVSGGAEGADQIGAALAELLGARVTVMKPDWDRHGKSAGFKRNLRMLDTDPDVVLAYWDGKSKGTLHTIKQAVERGLTVTVRMADGRTIKRNHGHSSERKAEICPECDHRAECTKVKGTDECLL